MSKKTKRYLMLLVAVGLIAVAAGGSGTFASFSAETANNGNYFQTGTLFLHNTANGTTCGSETAANNKNLGSGDNCSYLFQATMNQSGTPQYFKLALKNAGTLAASDIKFYANSGCQTVAAATYSLGSLSQNEVGAGKTQLHVTGGTFGAPANTTITVGSQTFITSAAVAPGAITIPINSQDITTQLNTGTGVTYAPAFAGGGDLCGQLQVAIWEMPNASADVDGSESGCAYPTNTPTCTFSNSYTLLNLPADTTDPTSQLNLLSGGGSGNTSSSGLLANGTRYFVIGIKPPADLANGYQNKKANVSIAWHIDQA